MEEEEEEGLMCAMSPVVTSMVEGGHPPSSTMEHTVNSACSEHLRTHGV